MTRQMKPLPIEAMVKLQSVKSTTEAKKIILEATGGDIQAATFAFGVLGANLAPWDTSDDVEESMTEMFISPLSPADITKAAREASETDGGAIGVARWLLNDGEWDRLTEQQNAGLVTDLVSKAQGDELKDGPVAHAERKRRRGKEQRH